MFKRLSLTSAYICKSSTILKIKVGFHFILMSISNVAQHVY